MEVHQQQSYSPFHHAIPSNDLDKSRQFYGHILGCPEGRTSGRWIDYNFYGSQLVAHFATSEYTPNTINIEGLPIPNFGVYLNSQERDDLISKLDSHKLVYQIVQGDEEKVSQIVVTKDFTGNNILFRVKA